MKRIVLSVVLCLAANVSVAADLFSIAMEGMLAGQRWTRAAWAGESEPRFVFMMRGSVVDIRRWPAREYFAPGQHVTVLSHFQTCRMVGTSYFDCTPWTPSDKDMLVADWEPFGG